MSERRVLNSLKCVNVRLSTGCLRVNEFENLVVMMVGCDVVM